jgi:hypothetical protein
MNIFPIAVSIVTGFGTGILYGLFFLLQCKKRVLRSSSDTEQPLKRRYNTAVIYSALRILTLFALWCFLLRSPLNHLILVLVSFLTAFWLVIIKDKAKTYDRRACSER